MRTNCFTVPRRLVAAAFIFLLTIIAVGASSAPAPASLTTYRSAVMSSGGLVGYWGLDENGGGVARDSVAGHDGRYVQTRPIFATAGAMSAPGGTSTTFDGRDEHADISGLPQLSTDLSVEAWVWLDRDGVASGGGFVLGNLQPGKAGWGLYIDEDHHLVFATGNSGGAHQVNSGDVAVGQSGWHHIVGTLKSGRTMTVAVDGKTAGTTLGLNLAPASSTAAVTLAASPAGTKRFNGAIDEVALYRRALSASEIEAHDHSGGDATVSPIPALNWPRPSVYFGFNDNGVLKGQFSADTDADLSAGAGANASRLTMLWAYTQPTRATYDFRHADAMYAYLRARRIRPVWTILGAPDWANPLPCAAGTGNNCNRAPGPANVSDLGDFAVTLARRYPQSAAIELWNEPNLRWGWIGPAYYAQMLQATKNALSTAGIGLPLLSGGLANAGNSSDGYEQAIGPYLQTMYDSGAKGSFDGLSMHPYQCYPCSTEEQAVATTNMVKAVDTAIRVRDANGDGAPLWLDEFGLSTAAPSGAITESVQSRGLVDQYRYAISVPGVKGVFVHTLVDVPMFTGTENGYGVMHTDLSPKPAYCALAQERGLSPC